MRVFQHDYLRARVGGRQLGRSLQEADEQGASVFGADIACHCARALRIGKIDGHNTAQERCKLCEFRFILKLSHHLCLTSSEPRVAEIIEAEQATEDGSPGVIRRRMLNGIPGPNMNR